MALRNLRNLTSFANSLKTYSTSAPFVNVTVNEKTGIATTTLQKPPVNSLNYEMLKELTENLQQLEKNKCRGMILTSSSERVFCAGLDILEMYQPNTDKFKQFWGSLQQVWIHLYGSSFPTAAVINGHAPAGGCLLALSCEYRIMLNNFTIGLNETEVGIMPPTWLMASMNNAIGSRQTELALTSGARFKTEEALKIGLIDEIAASKEEGLEKTGKFFQKFARVSSTARSLTKQTLRGPTIQALIKNKDKEVEQYADFIASPHCQERLKTYLQSLKQKQSK